MQLAMRSTKRRLGFDRDRARVIEATDVASDGALSWRIIDPPATGKAKRMMLRLETNQLGVELDRYAEGDETTLPRETTAEAELDSYVEEEIATLPWPRPIP